MPIILNNVITALTVSITLGLSPIASFASTENVRHDEAILPVPEASDLNLDKVQLGKQLFNDTRLSLNNKIACASCHQLESGGDDNLKIGLAHGGKQHVINTPSIFNARYNFRQNWDGSVTTLAGQIDKVVHDDLEANTNWAELINELSEDKELSNKFKELYSDGISRDSFVDSLTEYLMTLVTPNSPFDLYLKGNDNAINQSQKEGYRLFKQLGCISCHQGINIGGNLFQKLGIFYDYFSSRGNISQADYGRLNVTGKDSDTHVFKVPSLRNIEHTAPYLHDGSAKTLQEVIIIMGKTQLGRDIGAKEAELIEQFLKTLSGKYTDYITTKGNS